MKNVTEDMTLGAIVSERPGRSQTLERFGLDYCWFGRRALSEACADKGLDTGEADRPDRRVENGFSGARR